MTELEKEETWIKTEVLPKLSLEQLDYFIAYSIELRKEYGQDNNALYLGTIANPYEEPDYLKMMIEYRKENYE